MWWEGPWVRGCRWPPEAESNPCQQSAGNRGLSPTITQNSANNLNEPGASPDKIWVLRGPLQRNYWHPCHPRDPAQASYQSTKWVFKLHRLGCEPGHSRIPPGGALWKICKEQLSHLDLNSGEADAPPTLCPLVADVTSVCSVHRCVSTLGLHKWLLASMNQK